MRLTELFEDETPSPQEWNDAWISAERILRSYLDGSTIAQIRSTASDLYFTSGTKIDASGAIERAETAVTKNQSQFKARKDQLAQKQQSQKTKQAPEKPARDKVKRSITVPDADRTRKDAMGRNLKADRYYQELNKSQRGRDIIKKVSQKLGLPPEADEVIDYIADTMPTVIQKLDNLIANPADIGGALNPRNRRK